MSETWELTIAALIVAALLVFGLWCNLPTEPREKR